MKDSVPSASAVLVVRPDCAVLMVRSNGGRLAGWWGLPGGVVETDETPREAVERELREETGLHLIDSRPLGRYEVTFAGDTWLLHLYEGQVQAGEIVPEFEMNVGWLTLDDPDIHPTARRILADAQLVANNNSIDDSLEHLQIKMDLLQKTHHCQSAASSSPR